LHAVARTVNRNCLSNDSGDQHVLQKVLVVSLIFYAYSPADDQSVFPAILQLLVQIDFFI